LSASMRLKYQIRPIILKRLMRVMGITYHELYPLIGFGPTTFGDLLSRAGYLPGTPEAVEQYKYRIESLIKLNDQAMTWLSSEGLSISDIWEADDQPYQKIRRQTNLTLAGQSDQSDQSEHPMQPVKPEMQPDKLTITWEVTMLTPEAKKLFRLFKDPFIDDIQSEADLFMSEEHRYIEAAMLDAARHSGFLAVIGDVGSGKSTIRKKVFSQLKRDNNVLIISPRCIDKSQLTASSICDAVIRDISSENPKNRLEDKTRQVIRLLTERADSSQRHCLFIEEAHDLKVQTLKYLKRFYELEELENGFRRLLGIIMVGQLEMKRKLDERSSFDAREVIRRCQIVELGPLDGAGDLEKYLTLKFKRAGIEIATIFENDAYPALRERMSVTNGKSKISHLYPLLINNYTAKALNLAAQLGQKKVTAEVVYEV